MLQNSTSSQQPQAESSLCADDDAARHSKMPLVFIYYFKKVSMTSSRQINLLSRLTMTMFVQPRESSRDDDNCWRCFDQTGATQQSARTRERIEAALFWEIESFALRLSITFANKHHPHKSWYMCFDEKIDFSLSTLCRASTCGVCEWEKKERFHRKLIPNLFLLARSSTLCVLLALESLFFVSVSQSQVDAMTR